MLLYSFRIKKQLKILKNFSLSQNSSSKIKFKNLPADDPITREPDIQKARSILDWNPTTPRIEGLKKTILYFEGKLASRT